MKEPGVNIIFNGHMYYFAEPAGLDTLLDHTADEFSQKTNMTKSQQGSPWS